jgi:hypothetical protein
VNQQQQQQQYNSNVFSPFGSNTMGQPMYGSTQNGLFTPY